MELPNDCVKELLEAFLILGEVRRVTIFDFHRDDFVVLYRDDVWYYICDWYHTITFCFQFLRLLCDSRPGLFVIAMSGCSPRALGDSSHEDPSGVDIAQRNVENRNAA